MKKILVLIMSIGILILPIYSIAYTGQGQAIIGPPTTNVQRMKDWASKNGAHPEFINQAQNFYDISVAYGIDPAVTYSQSAKETNFFKFTGVLTIDFKNPCGLKTTAGGGNYDPDAHYRFSSWEEGITAQVHHLALYAGHPDFPKADSPDPRHFPSIYGKAPVVELLGGNWAPSRTYGVEVVERMKSFADVSSTFKLEEEVAVKPVEKPLAKPVERPSTSGQAELSGDLVQVLDAKDLDPMRRIFGSTRTQTALEISKDIGRAPVSRIILAPGNEFSSALLAASLTEVGDDNSPILLAGPDLNQDILNEIYRLRPKEVLIIGSPSQVTQGYEKALENNGYPAKRITGSNRYQTANLIAGISDSKDYILVNGTIFADALTISAYSADEGIPILFTDGRTLDSQTRTRLEGANSVLIVGGANSVSGEIERSLKAKTDVRRISGDNRFATAIEIAKTLFDGEDFVLTNGWDFPDSLSGSPLAASYEAPILLTDPLKLSSETSSYLRSQDVESITVLGGNNSISPSVYKDLSSFVGL